MKLKAAAIMLMLLSCAAARAQGEQVEIVDGHLKIIFTPPEGFPRAGADDFQRLSARDPTLRAAFGDLGALVRVNTFDALPNGVTDGDLESLKKKLERDVAADFPAAEWMSRDVVTIDGPRWLRLRYKVPGRAVSIVSDVYANVWFGKVVTVTLFNPEPEYERQRPAFEKSAATLRLIVSLRTVPEAKPARRPGRRTP